MSVKAINLRNRYLGRNVSVYSVDGFYVGGGILRTTNDRKGKTVMPGKDYRFSMFATDSVGSIRMNDIVTIARKPRVIKPKAVVKLASELTTDDIGKRVFVTPGAILGTFKPWEGTIKREAGFIAPSHYVGYSADGFLLVTTDKVKFL